MLGFADARVAACRGRPGHRCHVDWKAVHPMSSMGDDVAHIEAEVTFVRAEAGGRRLPVCSGYRGQFFYDGEDWDAVQSYPDVERVFPGDTVVARLTFISPEHHRGRVHPGM